MADFVIRLCSARVNVTIQGLTRPRIARDASCPTIRLGAGSTTWANRLARRVGASLRARACRSGVASVVEMEIPGTVAVG